MSSSSTTLTFLISMWACRTTTPKGSDSPVDSDTGRTPDETGVPTDTDTDTGVAVNCDPLKRTTYFHVSSSSDWTAVDAGLGVSCALSVNGTVTCWGDGFETPNPLGSSTYSVVRAVGWGAVCALDAAGAMTCTDDLGQDTGLPTGPFSDIDSYGAIEGGCGVYLDGSGAYCWGGDGDALPDLITVSVKGPGGCGLDRAGTARCWGPYFPQEPYYDDTPLQAFRQVSAGYYSYRGITTDDELICWGDAIDGAQCYAPEPGYRQVSVGDERACAIDLDGHIACWKVGSWRRSPAPDGEFVSVDTSTTHSCALRTDGYVVCWDDLYRYDTEEGDAAWPL